MKKRTITFVTSNNKKFEEVARWIRDIDPSITIEQAPIELPEYQSLDVHEIGLGKALEAWRIVQKPLFIDDGGIFLERYPLFPGTFSKFIVEAIGLEGIWKVAQEDPRASFKCTLVYIDGPENHQFFDGVCPGTLIEPKEPIKDPKVPYTQIFIPQGKTKTLSQLRGTDEEKPLHHRYKALQAMVSWLKKQKK